MEKIVRQRRKKSKVKIITRKAMKKVLKAKQPTFIYITPEIEKDFSQ